MTETKIQQPTRSWFITIIAVMAAACLLSIVLLVIVSANSNQLATNACAGMVTTPSFQIGIAWTNPISSYAPPLMFSKYKVCIDLPMNLSSKAINGEWMLPP